MRILLCGEGPHDIGASNRWDARRRNYIDLEGWLQPFVRTELGIVVDFAIQSRASLQLLPRDGNKLRLPGGHGAKAYLAKRAAVTGGYDTLVFMVDADSPDIGNWRRISAEIEAGFALLNAATRCVACIPMSASESWLLADPNAWTVAVGYDGTGLPDRPEAIWGARDDPAADHPHRFFFRICEQAGVVDDRETRVRIAEATSLSTARRRCPQSLEPFLAALTA